MAADTPLQMQTGIIFEHGHLARPWVPDLAAVREIDGKTFFAVKRGDRGFARAMLLDMTQRNPWDGAPFLNYLTDLRNKATAQ